MTDELVVIVPVLDRPQNVRPLLDSWKASGTPGDLLLVATATDEKEIAELEAARAGFDVTYMVTWPQKINWAVRYYDPEWFLFAADDITFVPGWWEATAEARSKGRVVGTNDGANPRCIAGEHSTHTLVARSYIEEHGTIDADEAVCSWYHHWYVDDELVWTAKHRDEWAHSGVLLPHHHPYFDENVLVDDTYRRGEANTEADRALWQSRARLLGLEVVF